MDNVLTILGIVTGICFAIVVAVGVLRLVDRFSVGRPITADERERRQRDFETRLACPQWDQLISHFGCNIPTTLRELYADVDSLRRESFYIVPPDAADESEHYFVAQFQPADLTTIEQACLPGDKTQFPFAIDDFGNYYFVDLTSHDLCVNYLDHDGGDLSRVADRLETFLKWPTYSESHTPE
ncbi:SMI1/KNR4 family protein [Fuerstiella marisgermanici]|uniref:Knr4/Smi1-like domain-containing protein n=1 Tax=Fuerstiella marisgermanici TaxID=1891926 RepID=A0A1P8WF63_9PLAN|nr:SMI1/KNR4 family protein [Fuerstiella marisgermanici]APZ92696.1 hypothetical protein Fuma_02308 [Fuerstiella marisgermanici]